MVGVIKTKYQSLAVGGVYYCAALCTLIVSPSTRASWARQPQQDPPPRWPDLTLVQYSHLSIRCSHSRNKGYFM